MISYLTEKWQENGLEWLAGIAVAVILLLALNNWLTNSKGSYSSVKPVTTAGSGGGSGGSIDLAKAASMSYMQHTVNDSKLELLSKVVLEEIFGRPFYKVRPDFLRNEVTGMNLEIDLYNDDLKLAVEVQGDQHYKFNSYFHKSKEHFLNQRYRDEMKKWKCKEKGITLVEVPYRVGEKRLRSYLIEQLRLCGFLV